MRFEVGDLRIDDTGGDGDSMRSEDEMVATMDREISIACWRSVLFI